jgi:hypothetical protein
MSNYITIAVTPQQLAILMNQQKSPHGATRLVVGTGNGIRAMRPEDVYASRGSYLVQQVAQPSRIVIHQPSRIVIHQPSGNVIHQPSGHQQPRYIPQSGGYIEPSGQAICDAYRAQDQQDRINRLFR